MSNAQIGEPKPTPKQMIEALRQHIVLLEQRIHALNQEIAILKSEERAEGVMGVSEDKLKRVAETVHHLRAKNVSLERDISNLMREKGIKAQSHQEEVNSYRKEIMRLTGEKAEMQATIINMRSEYEAKIQKLEKALELQEPGQNRVPLNSDSEKDQFINWLQQKIKQMEEDRNREKYKYLVLVQKADAAAREAKRFKERLDERKRQEDFVKQMGAKPSKSADEAAAAVVARKF